MVIRCLPDDPLVLQTVGRWLFDRWGTKTGRSSVENLLPSLRERTDCSRVPLTLVAFEQNRPVGTASLFSHDMDARPHLTPWLAGVFVPSEFRHREIGRRLCTAVCERARSFGYDRIHLWTPDRSRFYELMGWTVIERITYWNREVAVMRLSLKTS
jgi:GNAT superfamily N-acetyltransferase